MSSTPHLVVPLPLPTAELADALSEVLPSSGLATVDALTRADYLSVNGRRMLRVARYGPVPIAAPTIPGVAPFGAPAHAAVVTPAGAVTLGTDSFSVHRPSFSNQLAIGSTRRLEFRRPEAISMQFPNEPGRRIIGNWVKWLRSSPKRTGRVFVVEDTALAGSVGDLIDGSTAPTL